MRSKILPLCLVCTLAILLQGCNLRWSSIQSHDPAQEAMSAATIRKGGS